jgi:hypothetical protein
MWWKEFLTKKDFPIRFPIKAKVFKAYDLAQEALTWLLVKKGMFTKCKPL